MQTMNSNSKYLINFKLIDKSSIYYKNNKFLYFKVLIANLIILFIYLFNIKIIYKLFPFYFIFKNLI